MRIAFRCDAGPDIGIGHVMRSVALAEELASRGVAPVFVCDVDGVPWARRELDVRGYEVVPAITDVPALRPSAVVLDSYLLPAEVSLGWRAAGLPVLAIVDGDLRGQHADLYVDQNLGAELAPVSLPAGSQRLAGLDYAMFRNATRAARPPEPRRDDGYDGGGDGDGSGGGGGGPEVLAFFGGTDAYGAAPVVTGALAATGHPFTATVVAATAQLADATRAVPLASGQRVTTIPPTDRLPGLVAAADLVLSAAGTSTWELLCLGAAAAVVRVADNQHIGYDRTVSTGAVAGLGALDELRATTGPATAVLGDLLTSPSDRATLRKRAWHLVDGHGRVRVADALTALLRSRP